MFSRWYTRIARSVLAAAVLALLLVAVPRPVASAPAGKVQLKVQIAAVQRGETVTIRAIGFPARTAFTVRIGDTVKQAEKGDVVAEFTTEKAGDFDATYELPEDMREKRFLGIRLDGANGYYAYNWFINTTQSGLVVDKDTVLPELTFADVVQNQKVTIQAQNLAPNAEYRVRVGPYASFFRDYLTLLSLTSNEEGKIEAELTLPEAFEDAEHITVRLDSVNPRVGSSRTVSAAFRNQDGGAFVPDNELIKVFPCTVINTRGLPTMQPGQDFDAVWTVKNTGRHDWAASTVKYSYYSGARTFKYDSSYHVPYEVKRGLAIPITVDMVAPETPGWHSTTWELAQDGRSLCRMSVVFFVKANP